MISEEKLSFIILLLLGGMLAAICKLQCVITQDEEVNATYISALL